MLARYPVCAVPDCEVGRWSGGDGRHRQARRSEGSAQGKICRRVDAEGQLLCRELSVSARYYYDLRHSQLRLGGWPVSMSKLTLPDRGGDEDADGPRARFTTAVWPTRHATAGR